MDEKIQKALLAVSTAKRLSELHNNFMEVLAAPATECPNIGSITVSSGEIVCSCLERHISVLYRAVALNMQISALEYDFVTQWKDEELSVLRLYLQLGGILTRVPNDKERLCDFNNTYIHRILLSELSESLLNSPVYAPADD